MELWLLIEELASELVAFEDDTNEGKLDSTPLVDNEIEEDLDSESLLEKGPTEQPIVETTRRIKDEMKYFW